MNRVPDESHVACLWKNINVESSFFAMRAGKKFSESSDEQNQPVVFCDPFLVNQMKEVIVIRVFIIIKV